MDTVERALLRFRYFIALVTFMLLTVPVTGCGVSAALGEGDDPAVEAPTYAADLYLQHVEPQAVGFSLDPSGSQALYDGDVTWAASVQAMTADALARRLPSLPVDDAAWAQGAPGVGELRFWYLPVSTTSGAWSGEGSSIAGTIPEVPALAPKPKADQEDDVPGRYGKGAAWEAAKNQYVAAYEAAAAEASALSERISSFVLVPANSDVFGAVSALSLRMEGTGTVAVFSDGLDTEGNTTPPDLSGMTVIGVQACTATTSQCAEARSAFVQFVTSGGAPAPRVTGHEAARDVIDDLIVNGG